MNEDDADDADVDNHGYHEPLVSDDDIDLNEAYVDDVDRAADNPPRDEDNGDNASQDAYEDVHGDPEGTGGGHADNDDIRVQPDGPVEPADETHTRVELVDGTNTARASEGQQTHYNLRNRSTGAGTFRRAMDSPHNSKLYYPPAQMTQFAITPESLHFVVGLVLTQMTTRAGIKKHGK